MRSLVVIALAATLLACSPEPPDAVPAPAEETSPISVDEEPAEPDQPGWTRLANGLRVAVRRIDDAHDVAVLTVFAIAADHEPPGRSGLAHFVEHLYVTSAAGRTSSRTCEQMEARAPGWGAETHSRTTHVRTVVAPHSLDAELSDAAARMSDLRIAQSDLDRERPRMLDQIDGMSRASAAGAAAQAALERMYALPRGGGVGLRADVEKITLENARERCRRFYRPVNARLVVVGAIDPSATLALIERKFGNLPAGQRIHRVPEKAAVWAGRFDVDLARPGTADADCERAVCISCPSPPAWTDPASITIGYLVNPDDGAKEAFRFNSHDDRGSISFHWTGDNLPVEDVVKRFDAMIARLAERSPTPEDIARVVEALEVWFAAYSGFDERRGECAHPPDRLARVVAETGERRVDQQAYLAALAAVTGKDVRRVAAEWLSPERRVVAVVRKERHPSFDASQILRTGTARIRVVLEWDAERKIVRHRIDGKVQPDGAAFEAAIRSYAESRESLPNFRVTLDADPAIPRSELERIVEFIRGCGFERIDYTVAAETEDSGSK